MYPILPTIPTNETPTHLVAPKFLSNEECKSVIELSKEIEEEIGRTASEKAASKRVSRIRWIPTNGKADWVYERVSRFLTKVNEEMWRFDLTGFIEPFQLTHYKSEEGGYYDWHSDVHNVQVGNNRKLSGTILLNDNFSGGEFELWDAGKITDMKRGSLILFPSYSFHKVNKVTDNERWSLVFWAAGPKFK